MAAAPCWRYRSGCSLAGVAVDGPAQPVTVIVAAVSAWLNVSDAVWPTVTDVDWLGTSASWSPTPVPAVTRTVYAPGVRNAKNAHPSAVVACEDGETAR